MDINITTGDLWMLVDSWINEKNACQTVDPMNCNLH